MKQFKLLTTALAASITAIPADAAPTPKKKPDKTPNILLIVGDDLNCSTTPMWGYKVPDLMPNLAGLAAEGMLFRRAHVVSAASQVSRGGIMTGLYPYTSGIDGFYHTDKDIPTLPDMLQANNYMIGIVGKVEHSTPTNNVRWDSRGDGDINNGRDPKLYYERVKKFIAEAHAAGKPFFYMANSQDPHRPFAGSRDEARRFPLRSFPDPSRTYTPDEVIVPGFVPDLPAVRQELAEYCGSVHRLDEMVGEVLRALREAGEEQNTIVLFISDNGMSMPFSKTNCYLQSTHTPLVVRYPGVTKAGSEDDRHFVNGIDFMPTFLEAAGIAAPASMQGRSFLSLLGGAKQSGREYVYTEFTENSGRNREPMRAVQNDRFGYIYNAWSDGVRTFASETKSGLTWPAMVKAGETDPFIAARVKLFDYRVAEEFYDYEKDPDALHNLIDDPAYAAQINTFRDLLDKHMVATDDPVLEAFRNRHDAQAVKAYMLSQDKIVADRQGGKGKKKQAKQADE
ncbi:MAG: sulfatase [Rikenellaceae bacterium]|jgi:N-sulfoglucosamine sulfohydrolase|nr:sulfatase [Rikenellaceae bacterium]